MDAAGGALRNGACRLLIGVNCRDLRTLNVQFDRFMELAPRLPADIPRVAESGVQTPDQARELAAQGYQLALVGTALMRADAPADAARAILAAGRGACASS
jgi:indole-3-glycerol phosphate synthase